MSKKKIKFSSRKAVNKRLKVSSSGKIKHARAYTSHLATNKTTKQKRHLRKASYLHRSDVKRLRELLKI
jgi:large subunit ribosomal protein L35